MRVLDKVKTKKEREKERALLASQTFESFANTPSI
jgi:hypothetical protein